MPRTATSAQDAVLSGESSGTLERGLTVVRRLAEAPECRLRPGDLARTTGLARATVDRIVTTLVRLGYLRAESHDVLLAPRLLELGNAYLASNGLPDAVDALALRLADRLDESVSVCVPDRDGARFVTQIPRRRALAISFRTGDLLPAERCAPGALFAADWGEAGWELWRARLRSDSDGTGFPALPARRPARAPGQEADFESRVGRARSAGWALDDQLIEPGLLAVSVPVRGRDGSAVCSVSVISHTSRHTTASLAARALPGLRVCAADMEEAIAAPVTGPAAPVVPSAAPSTAAYLRATKDELGPDFLQSLARGLAVLASLRAPGGLTLSATAEATGLARATARRALLSLRQQGYVAVSPDGQRFTPLPRVLELGYAAQSRLTFDQIVMPHLIGLVRRVHDSATVAVLDGDEIRYAARVAASRIMGVDLGAGTRLPAHATALGRVLLAGEPAARLSQDGPRPYTSRTLTSAAAPTATVEAVRRDGYALVEQELEEGLRSVAVPVRDRTGRVVAAVSVAAHAAQRSGEALREEVLPELTRAAADIEADLAAVTERQPLPPPLS